jgi:hypothetical protein
MKAQTSVRSLSAVIAAFSLATSAVASAAPAAPVASSALNPLVALSVFGSAQSRAALCSVGAAAVAGAATSAAQSRPGCVLPVGDAPPPPVVAETPPPPPPMMAAAAPAVAPNLLPLLLGLGAFAAVFFLLGDEILGHDDADFTFPTSPA